MSFLLVGGIVLVSCYTGYFSRACRVFSWHWSSGDWVWNSEAEATVSCYLFYFNYNMKRMLYFKNAWLDFIWFLPRLRRLMLTCKENSLWPRFWAYFYFLFNKLGFFILSIFGLILSHLIGIFFTIFLLGLPFLGLGYLLELSSPWRLFAHGVSLFKEEGSYKFTQSLIIRHVWSGWRIED